MAKSKPEVIVEESTPKTTKLFQIVNLTSDVRDITMPNGTNIRLLAYKRNGSGFTSDPIDYDGLPSKFKDMLQKQVKRREIKIVEV